MQQKWSQHCNQLYSNKTLNNGKKKKKLSQVGTPIFQITFPYMELLVGMGIFPYILLILFIPHDNNFMRQVICTF